MHVGKENMLPDFLKCEYVKFTYETICQIYIYIFFLVKSDSYCIKINQIVQNEGERRYILQSKLKPHPSL